MREGFEPTFSTYRYMYRRYKLPLVPQRFISNTTGIEPILQTSTVSVLSVTPYIKLSFFLSVNN